MTLNLIILALKLLRLWTLVMNNLCRRWFDPRSRTAARNEVSNIFHHHHHRHHHHHHHHLNFTSQSCLSHNHHHIATCLKMFHNFKWQYFGVLWNHFESCKGVHGWKWNEVWRGVSWGTHKSTLSGRKRPLSCWSWWGLMIILKSMIILMVINWSYCY